MNIKKPEGMRGLICWLSSLDQAEISDYFRYWRRRHGAMTNWTVHGPLLYREHFNVSIRKKTCLSEIDQECAYHNRVILSIITWWLSIYQYFKLLRLSDIRESNGVLRIALAKHHHEPLTQLFSGHWRALRASPSNFIGKKKKGLTVTSMGGGGHRRAWARPFSSWDVTTSQIKLRHCDLKGSSLMVSLVIINFDSIWSHFYPEACFFQFATIVEVRAMMRILVSSFSNCQSRFAPFLPQGFSFSMFRILLLTTFQTFIPSYAALP